MSNWIKTILFFLILTFSVALFAQKLSEGLVAKNNGNEAFNKKDYVLAISFWEKYFESGEEKVAVDVNTQILYVNSFKYAASAFLKKQEYDSAFTYYEKYFEKGNQLTKKDGASLFNMAFTAQKLKKNDVALATFKKVIALGYKADVSRFYMADIYKNAGDESKMEEIVIEAISQCPDSKYLAKMTSMLKTPFLKEAVIPFNKANEMAKAASVAAPAEYFSKKELARAKFIESIPLFERVLKYSPQNEQALKCLKICNDYIQSFNDP